VLKGGKIEMENLTVKDIMTRPVISARKNASARDIALHILSSLYSGMPVTDENGKVIGVVTEFDLLAQVRAGKELGKLTADEIMTKDPVTVDINMPLNDVIDIIMEKNIIRILVTNESRLVGVIAKCDILRNYIEPEFVGYI
jgi:CBS domain-containing protein